MAGLQVLDGFAIPAAVLGQQWDHTYVTSSCGLVWPCFGRSSGGNSVCSATGDSAIADCLSQVNSKAGIWYGVTGVCHQASNRILYATGPQPATVSRCRGYQVSIYNYGPYGVGLWSERSKCMPPTTRATLAEGSMMVGFQLNDKGESDREIEALVRNARLHHPIEQNKLDRLSTVHNGFRRIQTELVALLQEGKIAPDEYLERYNSALRTAMRENESVLGRQDFVSVFGEAGLVPEGLIDRETFFSERQNDPPRLRSR